MENGAGHGGLRAVSGPLRNLALIVGLLLAVTVSATLGYMAAGWSFADAFYMVVLTIYTVGFREVRPIDSLYLRGLTMAVMFLGCTGMILMTGALVQLFTASEIRNLLGGNRMQDDIARLKGHTIVCGFGRIGVQLAQELAAAGAPFLVMERNPKQAEDARRLGYLVLEADATDEASLIAAGVERAAALATVLPDDATNVFITLSARNLNRAMQIISRGEAPTTERKLLHAGADRVILPTHIGAERIAELILHPAAAAMLRGSPQGREMERGLRACGLELEIITVAPDWAAAGHTVEALERAGGAFIARIDRPGQAPITSPVPGTLVQAGDGLLVVGRGVSDFPGAVRKAFAAAD